jgi:hypothetical protein
MQLRSLPSHTVSSIPMIVDLGRASVETGANVRSGPFEGGSLPFSYYTIG